MSRWKAFCIHLGLSALASCAIAFALAWRWYPPGIFQMVHADRLLALLVGISLVLGPLLTLIVVRPGKGPRAVRFDLCAIVLLQIGSLAYGLHNAWQWRPVYLVASERKVDLIFANEILPAKLAKAPVEYRNLPTFGPRTVGMLVPAEMNVLWAELLGIRNEVDPANYRPYAEIVPAIKKNALPLTDLLFRLKPLERASLTSIAHSTGVPDQHIAALPLQSTRGSAVMLIDQRSGKTLRAAALKWPEIPENSKPPRQD